MKRLFVLLVAAVVLTGCSSAKSESGRGGEITVYAAASLTESFTTLGKRYEAAHPGTHIRFSFGASSTLATQITEGAPADVFASASTKNMAAVVDAGEAADPATFAANTLEIATPPDNLAHVTSLAGLTASSVKVAVCDAAVPCGVAARKVFHNAGISVRPATVEADVKSVLAKVQLGEVDAGLVYVTDVKAAGSKVHGVPIPAAVNASTQYPIAALTHAENATLARDFVDFVRSSAGLAVLTAAGFSAP